MLDQSQGRCWYCGAAITEENWSRDHVNPRSKGGANLDNVVPCCKTCNTLKGSKTMHVFRNRLTQREHGDAPIFNEKQRRWLRERGFPIDDYGDFIFWFERLNLNLPGWYVAPVKDEP